MAVDWPAMADPGTAPRRRGRPPLTVDEDALHAAAVAGFARGGFRGARLEDIAGEAGLEKTILFRRFGSKPGLYRWVVDRESTVLLNRLMDAYGQADITGGADALRLGFEAIIAYALDHPEGFRVLFESDRSDAVAAAQAARTQVLERVEQVARSQFARAGQELGPSAGVIASMIVGAAESVARRCVADASLDAAGVVALLTEVHDAGLRSVRAETLAAVDGR